MADTTSTTNKAKKAAASPAERATPRNVPVTVDDRRADTFELPITHTRLSAGVVNATFWGGLAATVLVGAIDPPVAIVVGAGILIARHHR